jgi:hypothetical protein
VRQPGVDAEAVTLPDLASLLRALREAGVEFVVIGGVAVAAHEYVRVTDDLNLVPRPDDENLERLAGALAALDGRETLEPLHRGRNLSVSTRFGDAGIVQMHTGVPPYADLLADAISVEFAGGEINVCSRDHLIAMKRARGAPIDVADLERLTEEG